jgi:hypothetical protein
VLNKIILKTEPTKTVALCFEIPENTVSSSQLILCQLHWLDEEGIITIIDGTIDITTI